MHRIWLLLALCSTSIAYSAAENSPQQVVVDKVKFTQLSERLVFPAMIAPQRTVVVLAEVEGYIKTLDVELGQRVAQGAKLATLVNPDPVYSFAPFKVTSPFAGVVAAIDVVAGDRIQKGRQLLTLADQAAPKIKINVTAEDITKLRPKSAGKLTVGDRSFDVKIRAMSPVLDPLLGTAACELELQKPDGKLIPGSSGQVTFESSEHPGIFVNDTAVVYRGAKPYVMRLAEGNLVKFVAIDIVKRGLGNLEIKSADLKEGDTIITNRSGYIAEGEIVAPQSTGSNL